MDPNDKNNEIPLYFTVVSSSMYPVLKVGDKITAVKKDISELKVGDVVVYCRASKHIVHRIVRINGYVLVTAGDNLRKYDLPISVFDVVGVVENIPSEKPKSRLWRFVRAVKRRIGRMIR